MLASPRRWPATSRRTSWLRERSASTTSLATLLPLAVLVLVAAGLPLNLAGWGPREGMAAWAFAAAGLGAGQGVATAVAYGAMVLVANLPGASCWRYVAGPSAVGDAAQTRREVARA